MRVSYGAIHAAIKAEGAASVTDLQRLTGACTGCGCCRWDLEAILADEAAAPHDLEDTTMPTALDLAQAREWVARPIGMTAEEAAAVVELLIDGELAVDDGAALLRTWAERGETGTEVAGVVRLLRARAVQLPITGPVCDVCGTGGSGRTRYNVSTTVAVILAACGIPVAKHGNRGSRRPNGSFDLLDALGVPFELPPEALARLHADTGLCFIFARTHHPAVGAAVPYRKAAGGRSIFNLAGPLANPVPVGAQVIGTIDQATAAVMADAATELEAAAALVVWGHPGIDEISVTGPTGWRRIAEGSDHQGSFACEQPVDPDALPGGDAEDNAQLFHALLAGGGDPGLREMVCVNAGAAIDLWHGHPPHLHGEGYRLAQAALDEGRAAATFNAHRQLARELAGQED
ncbi:MAG: anthranilate phosphoribosyltransferase [Planctomycetota bacterium]|jgi:anthranilate phosphoribosyltransferase